MTLFIDDITLTEINNTDWLTVRTYNVCAANNLTSINKILSHYNRHKTFKNLKNSGNTTQKELIDICKKYSNILYTLDEKVEPKDILPELSFLKKILFETHFNILFTSLSVRAKNGLHRAIGSDFSFTVIYNLIVSANFQVDEDRNIGIKTAKELTIFKENVTELLKKIHNIENESELNFTYIIAFIKNLFGRSLEIQFNDIFNFQGQLRLFKLIEILINNDLLLNKKESTIFNLMFTGSEVKALSLDKIGSSLELTSERIRQIKSRIEAKFKENFNFIKNLSIDNSLSDQFISDSPLIVINEEIAKKFNDSENVIYNKSFYGKVISMFKNKSHTSLEAFKDSSGKRNKRYDRFKNYYLIKNDIYNAFNFEDFFSSIELQQDSRIQESYSLNFKTYIEKFFSSQESNLRPITEDLCQTILSVEYNLYCDSESICFEKNTYKPIHEYAFEILEIHGKLLSAEEIYNEIKKRYPTVKVTMSSIGGSLNTKKDLFICIGRTSTFGLKAWEIAQENIKGGTIKDIVVEYLTSEDEPKHIYDIAKYVEIYRDTNEISIYSNIQMEGNSRFVFYGGKFIGLKDKVYPIEKTRFKKIKGGHFNKAYLQKFTGWSSEDIIHYYVINFGYKPVQVDHILRSKASEGLLVIADLNNVVKGREIGDQEKILEYVGTGEYLMLYKYLDEQLNDQNIELTVNEKRILINYWFSL